MDRQISARVFLTHSVGYKPNNGSATFGCSQNVGGVHFQPSGGAKEIPAYAVERLQPTSREYKSLLRLLN